MKFINCTPHKVVLNDGSVFEPSGIIPRVSNSFTDFDENFICEVRYGQVQGLPEPEDGTIYIVSAMVMAACHDRNDLVAPATGHPGCIRVNGQIVSVPGFVRS